MTYDHLKQNYACFFAGNSIAQALCQLIAMLANKFHCWAPALRLVLVQFEDRPVAAWELRFFNEKLTICILDLSPIGERSEICYEFADWKQTVSYMTFNCLPSTVSPAFNPSGH